MMTWWCEKGIDGFRMDVISLISKPEEYKDGPVKEGEKYSFVVQSQPMDLMNMNIFRR